MPSAQRLAEIKVELDRYWDLLRRRRAAARTRRRPEAEQLRSDDDGRALPPVVGAWSTAREP